MSAGAFKLGHTGSRFRIREQTLLVVLICLQLDELHQPRVFKGHVLDVTRKLRVTPLTKEMFGALPSPCSSSGLSCWPRQSSSFSLSLLLKLPPSLDRNHLVKSLGIALQKSPSAVSHHTERLRHPNIW